MKKIPLSRSALNALVDDDNHEALSMRSWYVGSAGYPETRLSKKEGKKLFRMHRLIITVPRGLFIDHKDGNKLNNQRSNLRLCTRSQNMMNRGAPIQNTSGYKGVVWDKITKKWAAQIQVNNKHVKIGRYKSKEEAALAYNKAAKIYHGEFAYLNKI